MTHIINIFGSPGSGKSTTRAGVFHRLKLAGVNVEEVTEFAKMLTWGKREMDLACQPYVFGKQLRNMEQLMGQVDVIVTDSPLLLSSFYGQKYCGSRYRSSFYMFVADQFNAMDGMNILLRRVKPFNPAGRTQNEEESDAIGVELEKFLKYENVRFIDLNGDEAAARKIANATLELIL